MSAMHYTTYTRLLDRSGPLCGFSGDEDATVIPKGVTCVDCAGILGIEPAKREPQCCCGDSDVYDGWAECELHPDTSNERHYPPLTGPLPRLRIVK